jgi:hypothetical protein
MLHITSLHHTAAHKQNYISDLNSNHKIKETFRHEMRQYTKVQQFLQRF